MDISISLPFIGKLVEKVEKKLFLRYYQNSHSQYIKHHYTKQWNKVDKYGFAFKLHLENINKNNTNDYSYLMIKNDTNKVIRNININIMAESIFEVFIQNIFIDELSVDGKPQTIILNQIPFQELEFYEDGVIRNYNKIFVKLLGCNNVHYTDIVYTTHPTFTTFLNDSWKEKWGVKWNLQQIEDGKQNLREYIYSKIVGANISDMMIYEINYKHPRLFLKSIIYKCLANNLIINIVFWLLIWQNKIVENKSGYLHIKQTIE